MLSALRFHSSSKVAFIISFLQTNEEATEPSTSLDIFFDTNLPSLLTTNAVVVNSLVPVMPLNVGLVNTVLSSSLSPFNKVSPTTIKFLAVKVS